MMHLRTYLLGLTAMVFVVLLSSCGSKGGRFGRGSDAPLPPDGYVFDSGTSGYFGEEYGHGRWDPDTAVADPSIDLPGEYAAVPKVRPSASSAARPASSSPRTSQVSSPPSSSSKPTKPPSASSSRATSSSGVYRVGKGDALWGIARAHGTTVAAIKAANGLTSDMIYPGQKLRISGSRPPSASSSPSSSPSSSSSSSGRTHIVAKGDTLWGISRRYKVSVDAIKKRNGMTSDFLRPGDSLRIP